MPLLHTRICGEATELAVWDIRESEEELRATYGDPEPDSELHRIHVDARQQEWLASRLLVRELSGIDKMAKDPLGAPQLPDHPLWLSISHCRGFAAVGVSLDGPLGIDIEEMRPRILRIRKKFTGEAEEAWLADVTREEDSLIRFLTINWSVKEAVFKKYHKHHLGFRSAIFIEGPANAEGEIRYTCPSIGQTAGIARLHFPAKDVCCVIA